MIWYTCKVCPPHGMTDHSIYGDRKCLIDGCACGRFQDDAEKPLPKRAKPAKPSSLFRP